MKIPTLYLARHGETVWNLETRLQGRQDSPLTENGRAQAAQLNQIMRSIDGIETLQFFCSPLGRAKETASIALDGISQAVVYDHRLSEIAGGRWEGLTEAEMQADDPEQFARFPTYLARFLNAPEGEGFDTLADRCRAFLAEIEHPAVIITHGVVMTVMRGLLLGLNMTEMERLQRPQGSIFKIEAGKESSISK